MSSLAIVVATARGGAIGRGGTLPWIPPHEDMRWFRAVTMGHAVIMGHTTWQSIPEKYRPLVDRTNIVLSRRSDLEIPGVIVVGSLDEALIAAAKIDPEPRVIGGASVYLQTLPRASRLFVTELAIDVPDADAFFRFDEVHFNDVSRHAGNDPRLEFVVFERVGSHPGTQVAAQVGDLA
jgi:dihydrofolate reductase